MPPMRIVKAAAAAVVLATTMARADMVVRYSFEDPNDTTIVKDLVAGQYVGTVGGTATLVNNQAIVGFGAVNLGSSGYVDASSSLTLPSSFTISAWWKFTAVGSQNQVLFANCPAGQKGIVAYIDGSRRIVLSTSNGSATGTVQTDINTFPADGNYHSVTVTINRSASPASAAIYLDGVSVGLAGGTVQTDFATGNALRFGGYTDGTSTAQAILDDIRIYNSVLDQYAIDGLNWRNGSWEACRIGGGGQLYEMVFCPADPNRMYVTSDIGGMFRSDDKGATWRPINAGLAPWEPWYYPRGLSANPRNPDQLVMVYGMKTSPGSGTGIGTSTDGGKTWTPTLKSVPSLGAWAGDGQWRDGGVVLVRDAFNPNVIIAGTVGSQIYRSTNNGGSWAAITMPKAVSAASIVVDPTRPGRMWLASPNTSTPANAALYYSSNAGNTWQALNTSIPAEPITKTANPLEMIQDPANPDRLYAIMNVLQPDAANPGKNMWARKVMRSVVKAGEIPGTTWESAHFDLPAYPAGSTYTRPSWDQRDGIFSTLVALPDKSILVGAHGANFYKLANGATTWTRQGWSYAPYTDTNSPEKRVMPLGVPIEGNQWWGRMGYTFTHCGKNLGTAAVCPDGRWAFTDWYAIYFSDNEGANWRLSIDGIEMTRVHTVYRETSTAGADDLVHVGCGDVGYFRSVNGSRLLQDNHNGITNNVKSFASSPLAPGRLYAVSGSKGDWNIDTVYRSEDRGQSWAACPRTAFPAVGTVSFTNAKGTWSANAGIVNTVVAHPNDGNTLWAAVAGPAITEVSGKALGGLFKSTDAGSTWTHVPLPSTIASNETFFASNVFGAHQEVAVDYDGNMVMISNGTRAVIARPAGDANWYGASLDSNGVSSSPMCVVANTSQNGAGIFYIAAGWNGLWRSTDRGVSWKKIGRIDSSNADSAFAVTLNPDNPEELAYLTSTGEIWFSGNASGKNGNEQWQRMDVSGLSFKDQYDVLALTNKYIYVGTAGNGVQRVLRSALSATKYSSAAAKNPRSFSLKTNSF